MVSDTVSKSSRVWLFNDAIDYKLVTKIVSDLYFLINLSVRSGISANCAPDTTQLCENSVIARFCI